MRQVLTLCTLILCTSTAGARERRVNRPIKQVVADPRLAYVDDEPMSRVAALPVNASRTVTSESPLVSGSRMAIQFQAPQLSSARSSARTDERPAPVEEPMLERPAPAARPVSAAVEALAESEMKKNQSSVHLCTAQAVRRQPELSGKVQLVLTVGQGRVSSATVGESTVEDAQLERCLLGAAQKWAFDSMGNATFTWSVVVSPGQKLLATSH
jgi:hypothetical protein